MVQALINGKSISIEYSNKTVSLDGVENTLNILSLNNHKNLHLLYNNHSYFIEVLEFNNATKTYLLGFDGKTFEVGIKDRFDQLLHSMGLDTVKNSKVNELKAPMPGLVLSIKTEIGQAVKKGDAILILEAMKMENVIKSPTDGTIKTIHIVDKQAVDKNQILITFE
ncbi:MAG: acetyl-CoA carboxylase biotin carboxyl carrier protein subunit [bacterium]|nr:acetyl-CoA carboxylase biotin carboxyl carrier protein subunit [bacterium]